MNADYALTRAVRGLERASLACRNYSIDARSGTANARIGITETGPFLAVTVPLDALGGSSDDTLRAFFMAVAKTVPQTDVQRRLRDAILNEISKQFSAWWDSAQYERHARWQNAIEKAQQKEAAL